MAKCEYFWSQGCDPDEQRSVEEVMVDYPGAHFMCIKTMTQVGPDDRLAEPDTCSDDRDCYVDSGL